MAAEKYGAKLFSSGQLMAGILQSDEKITEAKADELAARWRSKTSGIGRAHDVVVLGSGAKFQPIQMPNSDAQFLESRKFQVIEVARMFGIPPHLLMDVERSTSWGTGIEQQNIGFVTWTMKAELARVEQRVTKELTAAGTEARYKVRDLLRGDAAARATYYQIMRNIEAMSVNEVRDDEDMPGIGPEGDKYEAPTQLQAVGAAAGETSKGAGDGPND
jgi:HK97 family phage portal protein